MKEKSYKVVGIMSGTSLDGLDLALCDFWRAEAKWKYRIEKAVTLTYDSEWRHRLKMAHNLRAHDLLLLHKEYGRFIGRSVTDFLGSTENVDLLASHGHTVFHEPQKGLTFQIGDGASIAAVSGITTVSDFRSLDVALGGQGAPLVPAGDEILFGEYDYCLNLGGFSNISFNYRGSRLAFDICPVNIVLNLLVQEFGMEYDKDGEGGREGTPDRETLELLNSLPYYSIKGPRSLGREWVESVFMPILESSRLKTSDKLRTVYQHIFEQFSRVIAGNVNPSVFVTGGGAFNRFLIEGLEATGARIIVPDDIIIKYKEALIFALLGLLKYENKINCFSSVTGASQDSSSGTVCHIKRNG